MKELICDKMYPLDTSYYRLHGSMAFDGCYYYFTTACDNIILKYNCCFELIEEIMTKRRYTSLRYDSKDNAFWATSLDELSCIYKLDFNFAEIDRICLNLCANITALSYCCCDNSIMVAIADSIYKLDKYTEKFTKIFTFHDCLVTGILSVCPVLIVTLTNSREQIICLVDSNNHICRSFYVPKRYMAEDMAFIPCEYDSYLNFYTLLTKKGCYSYMAECKLLCNEFNFCIDKCNYYFPNDCSDDCDCDKRCCDDIIESVAKVEVAISNILTAEGQKIKKILSTTNDVNKILCVNREVNQTIVNTTHLEQILYDKLTALDCDCQHKQCDE